MFGVVTCRNLVNIPDNMYKMGSALTDSQILQVMRRDFPEEFSDALQHNLVGAYARSYEDVARPPGGFVPHRSADLDALDLVAVRRARRGCGMSALMQTAEQFGIPYQLKRLSCNGQRIAVAQLGQVLLIAEPIDSLTERPEHARYKTELAASHFAIRQIEMDFSPHEEEVRYRQRIDARNTMLAVLQHGMRGGSFTRRDTALAMMNIAVPDATFSSWLWRANVLNDEMAMALDWRTPITVKPPVQTDRVTVTVKAGLIQKDR